MRQASEPGTRTWSVRRPLARVRAKREPIGREPTWQVLRSQLPPGSGQRIAGEAAPGPAMAAARVHARALPGREPRVARPASPAPERAAHPPNPRHQERPQPPTRQRRCSGAETARFPILPCDPSQSLIVFHHPRSPRACTCYLAAPPGNLPCLRRSPNVGPPLALGIAATVSNALRIFSAFFLSSFLSSRSARALP